MTRQEAYDRIYERLHMPENSEKYREYRLAQSGSQLEWHLRRAQESLRLLTGASQNTNTSLLENDFDVSIREIMKILDDEGWK